LEEDEYVLLGCQRAADVGDGGGDNGISSPGRAVVDAVNDVL
jgi:hypothetical protein